MSQNKLILKAFNTQLVKFVSGITKIYPNNKQIKSVNSQVDLAMFGAEKLIITVFKQQILPLYKTEILTKDENFFLNFEIPDGSPLKEFECLKEIYKGATTTTKDTMWKYIKILVVLAEKYNN